MGEEFGSHHDKLNFYRFMNNFDLEIGLFSLLSCLKRTRTADSQPVLLMVPPIFVRQLQLFNDAVEDLGEVYKLVINTSLVK